MTRHRHDWTVTIRQAMTRVNADGTLAEPVPEPVYGYRCECGRFEPSANAKVEWDQWAAEANAADALRAAVHRSGENP